MMLNKRIVECLKEMYPAGCRIILAQMDDVQAPPIGTQGTVVGVDDMGDILVHWDNGSRLSVVYGIDSIKKI